MPAPLPLVWHGETGQTTTICLATVPGLLSGNRSVVENLPHLTTYGSTPANAVIRKEAGRLFAPVASMRVKKRPLEALFTYPGQVQHTITSDTGPRSGHWFNMGPQFWVSLQAKFDLVRANK